MKAFLPEGWSIHSPIFNFESDMDW